MPFGRGRVPVGPMLAAGFLLAATPFGVAQERAPAQDPPQPLEPFRTEVNYIRVDMYPTASGKPVTDLQEHEIEIHDEGVPQKIERFEHVLVRGTRSQEVRRDPSSVSEMREAAQDVRARLFILFLDTEHVEFGAAINVRSPLIPALNQMIGGDDLVAIMTPEMQARDLTFTRKTTTIEDMLKSMWSARDHRLRISPEEEEYALCYPGIDVTKNRDKRATSPLDAAPDAGIAQEMILRRREVRTLDSLEELVRHLRYVREERKAVITISQGWRLYGDSTNLRRPLTDDKTPQPVPPVGVDGLTGRLGTMDRSSTPGLDRRKCELDRQSLSMLQNDSRFLHILRQANAGNTSFYTIDPRGLVVFDENIVPVAGVGKFNPIIGLEEDSRRLKARNDSLRTMAEVTDGIAIVQTGDLSAGIRRITDDLSSYYLLGFYSTRELDGKFHRLSVRVKRPGVQVRARDGYLAATRGDEAKAREAATALAKPVDVHAKAVERSLSALGIVSRERPLRLQVATGYLSSGTARIWGVAEVPAATGRHDWSEGGQADALVIDNTGQTIATERIPIAPGTRSVRFALGSSAPLSPGEYQVQLRAKGTSALAAMESVRVVVPAAPASNGALFVRRGITTGNQPMPTADIRFHRTERLTVEVPTTSSDAGTAQLLDRAGNALAIPVAAAIRQDADGSRWRTSQVALAPLAAGDYVVEQTAGTEKTLIAFRVLR